MMLRTVKQLLRRPIRSLSGILIVALAFTILVTCVGQYTATELTRKNLDDRYTTIGLISSEYFAEKQAKGSPITTNYP